jgi:hypothetical protein
VPYYSRNGVFSDLTVMSQVCCWRPPTIMTRSIHKQGNHDSNSEIIPCLHKRRLQNRHRHVAMKTLKSDNGQLDKSWPCHAKSTEQYNTHSPELQHEAPTSHHCSTKQSVHALKAESSRKIKNLAQQRAAVAEHTWTKACNLHQTPCSPNATVCIAASLPGQLHQKGIMPRKQSFLLCCLLTVNVGG